VAVQVQVVADQPGPRALLRAAEMAPGTVVHLRRLLEADLSRVTARAGYVVRARELRIAHVAIGAADVKPDAILHPPDVEVLLVREPRRLGLPRVFDRIRLHRGRERRGGDLGVADLAERPGRLQELLLAAGPVVARLVIVAPGALLG